MGRTTREQQFVDAINKTGEYIGKGGRCASFGDAEKFVRDIIQGIDESDEAGFMLEYDTADQDVIRLYQYLLFWLYRYDEHGEYDRHNGFSRAFQINGTDEDGIRSFNCYFDGDGGKEYSCLFSEAYLFEKLESIVRDYDAKNQELFVYIFNWLKWKSRAAYNLINARSPYGTLDRDLVYRTLEKDNSEVRIKNSYVRAMAEFTLDNWNTTYPQMKINLEDKGYVKNGKNTVSHEDKKYLNYCKSEFLCLYDILFKSDLGSEKFIKFAKEKYKTPAKYKHRNIIDLFQGIAYYYTVDNDSIDETNFGDNVEQSEEINNRIGYLQYLPYLLNGVAKKAEQIKALSTRALTRGHILGIYDYMDVKSIFSWVDESAEVTNEYSAVNEYRNECLKYAGGVFSSELSAKLGNNIENMNLQSFTEICKEYYKKIGFGESTLNKIIPIMKKKWLLALYAAIKDPEVNVLDALNQSIDEMFMRAAG